jgi:hypothetical protein
MFGHMHGVLNVDEKKLIAQFGWKPRDESFKPRGFQTSYVISFFISIRKPLPTSHETSDVTSKNFSSTN